MVKIPDFLRNDTIFAAYTIKQNGLVSRVALPLVLVNDGHVCQLWHSLSFSNNASNRYGRQLGICVHGFYKPGNTHPGAYGGGPSDGCR